VEILTNILTEQQFRQELGDAMSFLAHRGISDAVVSFGFTPHAPQLEDVSVGDTVPIADVPAFIAKRERSKGFRLGVFDCCIEPSGLDMRFNDRDVHVMSDNTELLDAIRSCWRAKGFSVYPDDLRKNA
jgi:hypothetical protein